MKTKITHTQKLIISLLDLEQSKTKSIIYKALSEERKKKQLNGHVKPQQKRNKIHKFTHTRTHRHAHTNTQTEKQHTHTL